ncbi:hypothetical protein [Cellvibrio sp. OA-2007]|uniref:hypothetical protein n=1 Tax=Cellvibrio sp. OA-2007 TaxID=529823 RepID=UPI000785070E|nr:hypothetical protein [Cellvibrio sp. OA-2007]
MMSHRFLSGAFSLTPVLTAVLFIALAVSQAWPFWQQAFRSDHSSISWLSSAQLWAIAFVSLLLIKEQKLPTFWGGWFFLAMLLMAMDEQFQFHEQWKYGCDEWVSWCDSAWAKELPMLSIAVLGSLSVLWLYHHCGNNFARLLLVISIVFGAAAIIIDLASVPHFIGIFEEGFEVLAEAFWLSYLFALTAKGDYRGVIQHESTHH